MNMWFIRQGWCFLLVVGMVLGGVPLLEAGEAVMERPDPQEMQAKEGARIQEMVGKLPLYFIENKGQMDGRVAYYVQGADTTLYFTQEGVTFGLTGEMGCGGGSCFQKGLAGPQPMGRWVVKLDFVGGNSKVQVKGEEVTPAQVSYFKGSQEAWKTGLATYARLVYPDLWPGIDLVYEGAGGRLKGTFRVKPGADPAHIQLAYRGAKAVSLTREGRIQIETPVGNFAEDVPVSYQDVEGKQLNVPTTYALIAPREGAAQRVSDSGERKVYGFTVGPYDRERPLVIDPVTLIYAGYIGGSTAEYGYDIAVDSGGSAYVTGYTTSYETTFPVTVGPDLTYNESSDTFVAKVKADGTGLTYAGYIGGGWYDYGVGIAVDSSGAAYIVGYTASTETTFPVTGGPDLTHNGGVEDVFVVKVKADGTGLTYAGYIGGAGADYGTDIAVDGSGFAYVVGWTDSTEATFPDGNGFGTVPGLDLTYNGDSDVFVAKVNSDGTGLTYAGYIGGVLNESGAAITVDSSGAAYVTGLTFSSEATFPVVVGPDLVYGDSGDAFVAKVKPSGTAFDYIGYIGGSVYDRGDGIAVDSSGAAYVAGYAGPPGPNPDDFPVAGGPDLTYNGGGDVFVAKVKADGTGLTYAGYIGGLGYDVVGDIALDGSGAAYVVGATDSSEATFPDGDGFGTIPGPDLTYNGGTYDAFVAKVKADGSKLDYASYVGGSGYDGGGGIAMDSSGAAYVVGSTASTEADFFPVVVGPDLTHGGNGSYDAFVVKLCEVLPCPPPSPPPPPASLVYAGYIGGSGIDAVLDIAVDSTGATYVTGYASSFEATFPDIVGPDLTYNGGPYDAFVAKTNAAGTGLIYAGYIGGSGYDYGHDIAVDSSGAAYIVGVTASSEATFPDVVGPDLMYNGGTYDAFVAKVNSTGTGLTYAGYIGGSGADYGYSIVVDSSGVAIVVGITASSEATFPEVVGPDLTYNGGTYDAFVAKVNAAGTGLTYAGYIGGSGYDTSVDIAVDNTGAAYVTGYTASSEATFPEVVGPDLTYNGGTYDAFMAKVNSAGTGLTYAGYIGGSGTDYGNGIAVDSSGAAYVTGYTASSEATFPEVVGPDLTYNGGTYDAFVAKVNSSGTGLTYAGYIGGSGYDICVGIAVDSSGAAYVVGSTTSSEATFPEVVGPDLTYNGGYDAFVAKVNSAGSGLTYAGYIGGSGTDYGYDIVVDSGGAAYVVGTTTSSEATFPEVVGPDLTHNGGTYDGFVAKVAPGP